MLTPYPAYKDSGVPWLGRVPEHWDICPGFSAFQEKFLKNTGMVEQTVLSLSYGRLVVKPSHKLHGLVPESFETYQIVDPGEIIIRPTDLQNDWNSLRVGIARNRGIITSAYICLRTLDNVLPDYGYLVLHAYDLMKVFYGMGSGLRQNLNFKDLKRMPVAIPTVEEQEQIVKFLNYKTAQIARFIRSKQRMIALLREQKQAIINQAVTGQINVCAFRDVSGSCVKDCNANDATGATDANAGKPYPAYKPSGVAWLGEIPAHWGLSRLKSEATHIVDCLHATPEYLPDGQYPAIRTADIEPGKVRLAQTRKISVHQYALWTSRLIPQKDDILYSREGERYGIAALVPEGVELCISQRMMIFRIKPSQNSEFLMWQLNCPHIYAQASCDIIGSTSPHVNVEQIKNFRLVIPPKEEQKQIVLFITRQTTEIDDIIARTYREIALMQEYRARLIADVVTGRIDARGIAVPDVADDADEEDISIEEDMDNNLTQEAQETL